MTTTPRLPYAPLRAALERRAKRELTFDAQAQILGVTRRTVHRYAGLGIELDQAERFACHVGLHPASVWGDEASPWAHLEPLQPLQPIAKAKPKMPRLARFLAQNQCPHCLGWSTPARRLAEVVAGRPGRMRPCVCDGPAVATGQEPLDFGGAA